MADNKNLPPENSYAWEDEMNEQADALMHERGHQVPPISELLKDAKEISQTLASLNTPSSSPYDDDTDDIEKMIAEQEEKEVYQQVMFPHAKKSKPRLKLPLTSSKRQPKPKLQRGISSPSTLTRVIEESHVNNQVTAEVEDEFSVGTQDTDKTPTVPKPSGHEHKSSEYTSYQESFTSQQESAALREQMEMLDRRLEHLESTFHALVKERENLPKHIDSIRTEINTQLTLMNEKMYTAIEINTKESLSEAKSAIDQTSVSSNEVLKTLSEDTSSHPSTNTKTSGSNPIVGKRKKVQLIV